MIGLLYSVHICRDRLSHKFLCYAYVNFHLPSHAAMALLRLNHTLLRGKPMRIIWCERDLVGTGIANLFVKNLDSVVTDAKFEEVFEKFGRLLSCKIVKDDHGKSKGFGFVQLDSEESANNAIESLDGTTVDEKIIRSRTRKEDLHFNLQQHVKYSVLHTNKKFYMQNVDARLASIKETAAGSKKVLDGHVSSFKRVTSDAKRKWHDFSMQAENDASENADFAASKHCRIESLLHKCVDVTDLAQKHSKKTHNSVTEMGRKHVAAVDSLVRSASNNNEHHDAEIVSLRANAEGDALKNSEDISNHINGTPKQERKAVSAILETTKSQAKILESLQEAHARQSSSIEQKTHNTFQHKYMGSSLSIKPNFFNFYGSIIISLAVVRFRLLKFNFSILNL